MALKHTIAPERSVGFGFPNRDAEFANAGRNFYEETQSSCGCFRSLLLALSPALLSLPDALAGAVDLFPLHGAVLWRRLSRRYGRKALKRQGAPGPTSM